MNILITGGASGLGEAITRTLAKDASNTVIFTFNKSADKAIVLEKEFTNVKSIKCDFTSKNELRALVDRLETLNIDVLINNALSNFTTQHFHKIPADTFENSFKNNVLPTLLISQKAVSIFRKKKFGKIITILSSYLAGNPPGGLSEYIANKNYLLSMSKSIASENASFHITSNCISPSFMQTNLTKNTDERIIETMIQDHPLKKLITPEEVAESIAYLTLCPQHINGINLVINSATNVI